MRASELINEGLGRLIEQIDGEEEKSRLSMHKREKHREEGEAHVDSNQ